MIMKNRLLVLFVFLFLSYFLNAQNYIGYKADEIKEKMKEAYPDFKPVKVINKTYNYLKYTDSMEERTILFFLSDDNRCTFVKLMSDYSYLDDFKNVLNKKYEEVEEGKWEYEKGGEDYTVTMKKGEWFFTLITKKK